MFSKFLKRFRKNKLVCRECKKEVKYTLRGDSKGWYFICPKCHKENYIAVYGDKNYNFESCNRWDIMREDSIKAKETIDFLKKAFL